MDLFESVIQITEERDTKSINKSLLTTLAELIDFNTLVLFHRPRSMDTSYIEVSGCLPANMFDDTPDKTPYKLCSAGVELDDELVQCIDSAEVVNTTFNNQSRTLIPIIINKVVTDVLDIQGHNLASMTEKNVHFLIQVFNNFLIILDDNEHDTLTGLLNRKTFDNQLSELIALAESDDAPKASTIDRRADENKTFNWIGVLDIDHFKNINDTYGHMYGDEILLLFSNLMKRTFRGNDLLFRYGGEEFVVVLSPTSESNAMVAFDRFRQTLESYDFPQVGCVTASLGVVRISNQEHPTTLLEQADKALYYAKDHGRNQVCNYHALISSGKLQETHIADDLEFF
jgi:diguanylate cyclase (GGDEF)-like protein